MTALTPTIETAAGLAMPRIIYGTAWKKQQTVDLVNLALAQGFRGIDTAGQPKHYAEALVGQAVQQFLHLNQGFNQARASLFIQTKFTPIDGQDPLNIPYDPKQPLAKQVEQSFEQSLQNLFGLSSTNQSQSHYVDSYVLHSPLSSWEDMMTVWQAMERLVSAQRVRQLGISNCYDLSLLKRIYQEANVKPAVVQNRFYAKTNYDAALREWCTQHQIVYQSFWTLTANPEQLNHPTLTAIAQNQQKSPAQILFRYLQYQGIVPLTGTTSKQHMREDLATLTITLSESELSKIDQLFK